MVARYTYSTGQLKSEIFEIRLGQQTTGIYITQLRCPCDTMMMFLLHRHYLLLLSTLLVGRSRSFQPHGTLRTSFAALPRCTTRGKQPFSLRPSCSSTGLRNNMLDASFEQVPNQSVISAVERLGGKGVLPSDIAAAAGISLSQAKQELTRLAAVSQALSLIHI